MARSGKQEASGGRPGRRSWLGRMDDKLKAIYGPAQVQDPGQPQQRSADRLQGLSQVSEGLQVHRNRDGRAYVVVSPEESSAPHDRRGPGTGTTGRHRHGDGDGDEPPRRR